MTRKYIGYPPVEISDSMSDDLKLKIKIINQQGQSYSEKVMKVLDSFTPTCSCNQDIVLAVSTNLESNPFRTNVVHGCCDKIELDLYRFLNSKGLS